MELILSKGYSVTEALGAITAELKLALNYEF